MKPLSTVLIEYASYHRHPTNKLLHFFGVPVVSLALFIAMSWIRVDTFGMSVTLAFAFALGVFVYYFILDVLSALSLAPVFALLLYIAELVVGLPLGLSVGVFFVTLVVGVVIQLLGHRYEGNKPALMDNFFQIFSAPLFLVAETYFSLGVRTSLKEKIERVKTI